MSDDDVEVIAQAIHTFYERWASEVSGTGNQIAWNDLPEKVKDLSRDQARAVIAALEARGWQRVPEGYVVVPVDATAEMAMRGAYEGSNARKPVDKAAYIYRAMIAARPRNSS